MAMMGSRLPERRSCMPSSSVATPSCVTPSRSAAAAMSAAPWP